MEHVALMGQDRNISKIFGNKMWLESVRDEVEIVKTRKKIWRSTDRHQRSLITLMRDLSDLYCRNSL